MTLRSALASAALLLAAVPAAALPVVLDQATFVAQIAGLPTIADDLERFPIGDQPAPLVLENGTYSSSNPQIQGDNPGICGDLDRCLLDAADLGGARTFSAFPSGTTYWGTDFTPIPAPIDLFEVTVTGESGTIVHVALASELQPFVGFHDPAGLLSVVFVNRGAEGRIANYAFDNVTTAVSPRPVPEPSSMMILGAASAGVLARRRRGARVRGSCGPGGR